MAWTTERLMARIAELDGCWLWTGTLNHLGYGTTSDASTGRKHVLAHRLVYETMVGPIPEGLTLDHLCRVRRCVNPSHLEPCTLTENLRRGESPSARNARKTHCIRGHEFTIENTYMGRGHRGEPRRYCRTCVLAAAKQRRDEKAAG